MTRTQRFADGYVERKRVMSSHPKKATRSKKRHKGNFSEGGFGWIVIIGIIGLLSFIFKG